MRLPCNNWFRTVAGSCQQHCFHMPATLLAYADNPAGKWQQPYRSNSSDQQIRYL